MNQNLVGSTYGRFCIKFPQSRIKGERHVLVSCPKGQVKKNVNVEACSLFMIILELSSIRCTIFPIGDSLGSKTKVSEYRVSIRNVIF